MNDEFGKTKQDVKIDKISKHVDHLIKFNKRYRMSVDRGFQQLIEKHDKHVEILLRRFRVVYYEMGLLSKKIDKTGSTNIKGDHPYEH